MEKSKEQKIKEIYQALVEEYKQSGLYEWKKQKGTLPSEEEYVKNMSMNNDKYIEDLYKHFVLKTF